MILQSVWLTGLYDSSLSDYRQTLNQCLKQASDTELRIRILSLGDQAEFWSHPKNNDTSKFSTGRLETKDTIISFRVKRNDPDNLPRVQQAMLNFFLLLDVNATDSLLKECMSEKSIQAGNTYVEHIDLRKNCVIADNAPEHKLSGYTESDTLILDILNTVGVKAYVYASVFTILKPFKSRLIWLAVLTLAEVGCLFWLLRSLFRQEREKKERVRFMLTAMDEINGMASNAEKEMNHLSKILKRE